MKVLLVDDEERFVSMLAKRLILRGIDAHWLCSGEEALKEAEKNHYDLALLDVKMPCMSGIELRKKLHELRPDMKFIFLTGHGSKNDFDAGSAKAAFYLAKPLKIEDVLEKIHEAVES